MRVIALLPLVNLSVHVAGLYVGGHHKRSDHSGTNSPTSPDHAGIPGIPLQNLDPPPSPGTHPVASGYPHSPTNSESSSQFSSDLGPSISRVSSTASLVNSDQQRNHEQQHESPSVPKVPPHPPAHSESRPTISRTSSEATLRNPGDEFITTTQPPAHNPNQMTTTPSASNNDQERVLSDECVAGTLYGCYLIGGTVCMTCFCYGCCHLAGAVRRSLGPGQQHHQAGNSEKCQACPPHYCKSAPQKGKRSFVKDVYRRRIGGWGDLDGLD
ncbi:hypothetical protein FB446DRAFT_700652 [Lentinula raphanica]|nr:hypothetical protein FB446DRAFT_700652 [Lentinula raphanica]